MWHTAETLSGFPTYDRGTTGWVLTGGLRNVARMMRILAREAKRATYGILALPVTGYAALFGGRHGLAWLSRLLDGEETGTGRTRYGPGLLVSVPAFALSALLWYLAARIATYGLTWSGESAAGSWGGPGLAGAWTVHALCALGLAVVAFAALAPITRLHSKLTS